MIQAVTVALLTLQAPRLRRSILLAWTRCATLMPRCRIPGSGSAGAERDAERRKRRTRRSPASEISPAEDGGCFVKVTDRTVFVIERQEHHSAPRTNQSRGSRGGPQEALLTHLFSGRPTSRCCYGTNPVGSNSSLDEHQQRRRRRGTAAFAGRCRSRPEQDRHAVAKGRQRPALGRTKQ